MNNLLELLRNVSTINDKYEIIAQKTGNNFNIFDVLNIKSDEVKHSKFLAEILNSKGLHNQGNLFFLLFLDCLNKKYKEHFSSSHSKSLISLKQTDNIVLVEESVGEIDLENATGGRLDIVIKGKKGDIIVIENKIYANDQKDQLKRYHNKYPTSILLYLTLNEKEPSDLSKSDLKKDVDYFCISYKEFITNWIELCIQKVINKPFIRENLSQYLQIIKSLTYQSETMEQSNEIINSILNNSDNFLAAKEIAGTFENAKNYLLYNFWTDVKSSIENKYPEKTVEFTKGENFTKDAISAIFIKADNQETIGVEPLNGLHPQKQFRDLYIGLFGKSLEKKEENSPFPEWRNVKILTSKLNFAEIETLNKILPNSESRKEIIKEILDNVQIYITIDRA